MCNVRAAVRGAHREEAVVLFYQESWPWHLKTSECEFCVWGRFLIVGVTGENRLGKSIETDNLQVSRLHGHPA